MWSRGACLSPHRGPPPFCPRIAAALAATLRAARGAAAAPPLAGTDPAPRWTLRRLVGWVREHFGGHSCRETIRAALHRLGFSWKKAKKLLGRADPEKRRAFLARLGRLLAGARRGRYLLVYWDEAHIHQDADLGYGWAEHSRRFWVASRSPGLAARLSFYGLYFYPEGTVRLWPSPRANGAHTIEVLRRLRAEWPERPLLVLWDGASYHRAACVREAAAALGIKIMPLPAYSPDLMPVEALWRWLREDVTYHYCHPTSDDLRRRIAAFERCINRDPHAVAHRLRVKRHLDPSEEKLRFPN